MCFSKCYVKLNKWIYWFVSHQLFCQHSLTWLQIKWLFLPQNSFSFLARPLNLSLTTSTVTSGRCCSCMILISSISNFRINWWWYNSACVTSISPLFLQKEDCKYPLTWLIHTETRQERKTAEMSFCFSMFLKIRLSPVVIDWGENRECCWGTWGFFSYIPCQLGAYCRYESKIELLNYRKDPCGIKQDFAFGICSMFKTGCLWGWKKLQQRFMGFSFHTIASCCIFLAHIRNVHFTVTGKPQWSTSTKPSWILIEIVGLNEE